MPDPQRMEYMAWPRMTALAEVLWSPRETRDDADFKRRLEAHLERMRILDVNYWRPRR
jgi:hexosaminidase